MRQEGDMEQAPAVIDMDYMAQLHSGCAGKSVTEKGSHVVRNTTLNV